MDESGQESKDITPQYQNRTFSRREFLVKAGLATAGVGALGVDIAKSLGQGQPVNTQRQETAAPASTIAASSGTAVSEHQKAPVVEDVDKVDNTKSETASTAILGAEETVPFQTANIPEPAVEVQQPSVEVGPLFANCDNQEKIKVSQIIENQVLNYKADSGIEKLKKDTLGWKNLVYQVASHLGFKKESIVPEYMCGLIYVESKGAESMGGKKLKDGICQIDLKSATAMAEEIKKDHNLQVAYSNLKFKDKAKTIPDLNDASTNISLSLMHINRLFKLFVDPGIVFQTYNLGEKNMTRAVGYYMELEMGLSADEVNKKLNDPKGPATPDVINQYGLNWVKIMTSEKVRDNLIENEKVEWDITKFYAPKIEAAKRIVDGTA